MTEKDAFLFFFAGHGDQEERTEAGFLLASDSAPDDQATVIPISADSRDGEGAGILEAIRALPCYHKLMILDCCFSGSLFTSRAELPSSQKDETSDSVPTEGGRSGDNLETYFNQKAFFGISAGRDTPVADGEGSGNSIFTNALLKIMQERANSIRGDHAFTFRQLAAQVEGEVAFSEGSFQVPDSGRLGLDPGDGDFVFQVEKQPDPRPTPRERERMKEARELLIKAEQAKGIPDGQLLAARAIGFHGYRQSNIATVQPVRDRFPPLLHPLRDSDLYQRAIKTVKGPVTGFRPVLVWSSPISVHHSSSIGELKWSPDGTRLLSSSELPQDEEAEGTASSRLWDLANGQVINEIKYAEANEFAWSPDGARLATSEGSRILLLDGYSGEPVGEPSFPVNEEISWLAWNQDGTQIVSTSWRGSVRIWDVSKGQAIARPPLIGHRDEVYFARWSPDGSRLFTESGDNTVRIWDAATGKQVGDPIQWGRHNNGVTWSPDGMQLATVSENGQVRIWDASTAEMVGALEGHQGEVGELLWGPDGKRLLWTGQNETSMIWDAASRQLIAQQFTASVVDWNTDGSQLAVVSDRGSIQIRNSANGDILREFLHGLPAKALEISWNKEVDRLAVGSMDGAVRIWSALNGTPVGEPIPPATYSPPIWSLRWSPDGTRLLSVTEGESARLWDATNGEVIRNRLETGDSDFSWSPDGKWLAGGKGGRVQLWEASNGKELGKPVTGHDLAISGLSWSHDGSKLASLEHNTIRIWNSVTGEMIAAAEGKGPPISSVAWTPDGKQIAAVADGEIQFWDAETGERVSNPVPSLGTDYVEVQLVAWSPDGWRIASTGDYPSIHIHNWRTGEVLATAGQAHYGELIQLDWSPDGTRLASASNDGLIKIWDTVNLQQIGEPFRHAGLTAVDWTLDGGRFVLASASEDGTIQIWDGRSAAINAHPKTIRSLAWKNDGTVLASASDDGTVRLWRRAGNQELWSMAGNPEVSLDPATISGHDRAVRAVAWSPDGSRLATGSDNGIVRIWDTGDCQALGEPLMRGTGHLEWNPEGRRLASMYSGKIVNVWDVATGVTILSKRVEHNSVDSMSWGAQTDTLALAADGKVYLWNPDREAEFDEPIEGFSEKGVNELAWSPDGSILACGIVDGKIQLWNGSKITTSHESHDGQVNHLAWNRAGTMVASASGDGVRVWNATNAQPVGEALIHTDFVSCVAWSPDGTRLASASGDGLIRLWDADSGNQIGAPLSGHTSSVWSVAWNREGTYLASTSSDGTIRLWDGNTGKAIGEPIIDYFAEVQVADLAWNPDGTQFATASEVGEVRFWQPQPSTSDREFTLDLSAYLQRDWARIDPGDQSLRWNTVSDDLFSERRFDFVNLRPNSITALLKKAEGEQARYRILFEHYLERRLWKPAWACYLSSPENQTRFAPDLFRRLYLASASSNPRYPEDWLASCVRSLLKNHPDQCQGALETMAPYEWKHFTSGIAAKRKNTGLETLALDSLELSKVEKPLIRALLLFRTGRASEITQPLPLEAREYFDLVEKAGEQGRKAEFAWILENLGTLFLVPEWNHLNGSVPEIQQMAGWFWLGFGENHHALTTFQAIPESVKTEWDLVGYACAQWASGDRDGAIDSCQYLLSLSSRFFTPDKVPPTRYSVRDHLNRPIPLPALTELHEASIAGKSEPRETTN